MQTFTTRKQAQRYIDIYLTKQDQAHAVPVRSRNGWWLIRVTS